MSCIVSLLRSLPKLSSQDDDGSHAQPNYTGASNFEPIPHDHDSCERVVINVSTENIYIYI